MKKFVFPLETLLRVRRQHEDVAKRDFALALGRQSRAEEAVREIDRRTAEARAELAALQKGSVDVRKIVSYYRSPPQPPDADLVVPFRGRWLAVWSADKAASDPSVLGRN